MSRCCICKKNDIENLNTEVVYLSCTHHTTCLEEWFNKGNGVCLLCNAAITDVDIKINHIKIINRETFRERGSSLKLAVFRVLIQHINHITFEKLVSKMVRQILYSRPNILIKFTPTVNNLLTLIIKEYDGDIYNCTIHDNHLEYFVR